MQTLRFYRNFDKGFKQYKSICIDAFCWKMNQLQRLRMSVILRSHVIKEIKNLKNLILRANTAII